MTWRNSRFSPAAKAWVSDSRFWPPAGQGQEVLARVGEGDAALALAPVEQGRAHLVLQRSQPGGERGLGDEQRVRRRRHRAVVQYGKEGFNVLIGHGNASYYSNCLYISRE